MTPTDFTHKKTIEDLSVDECLELINGKNLLKNALTSFIKDDDMGTELRDISGTMLKDHIQNKLKNYLSHLLNHENQVAESEMVALMTQRFKDVQIQLDGISMGYLDSSTRQLQFYIDTKVKIEEFIASLNTNEESKETNLQKFHNRYERVEKAIDKYVDNVVDALSSKYPALFEAINEMIDFIILRSREEGGKANGALT